MHIEEKIKEFINQGLSKEKIESLLEGIGYDKSTIAKHTKHLGVIPSLEQDLDELSKIKNRAPYNYFSLFVGAAMVITSIILFLLYRNKGNNLLIIVTIGLFGILRIINSKNK
jgi:hypothetical protein